MANCPHGAERNRRRPDEAFTEAIYRCTCCASDFTFIEARAWNSRTGEVHYRKEWQPKPDVEKLTGLCGDCGGRLMEHGSMESGGWIEYT
jgi:hypothetical protein